MGKVSVETMVEGGKASAGPPVGPMLGPTGVNLYAVVTKINELTKDLTGLKVPVKIIVDEETKEFEVEIGVPPTSALILKEAGVSKGSQNPSEEKVSNIKLEQIVKIANAKKDLMFDRGLKRAVKTVLGTCVSMGITIDGEDPRDIQKKIDQGEFDGLISKAEGK